MSYEAYKVIHLLGMALILTGLGGFAVHSAGGGDKKDNAAYKALAICHSVGLLLSLVAGFGLLARLGLPMTAGWIWAKLGIFLFLGAASTLVYKVRGTAGMMIVLLPILGGVAAWLAIFKPF